MERLNYDVLKKSGYKGYILEDAPVKMLQFGEGNFLRAFVDYYFDVANEKAGWNGKAILTQPRHKGKDVAFNEQEGLYTLYIRGNDKGKKVDERRVVSVVKKCYNPIDHFDELMRVICEDSLEYITSNTTEAGIVYDGSVRYEDEPPATFPAKLAKLLFERFKAGKKGLIILSCELIDANGKELKKFVLRHIDDWELGADFRKWVDEENIFCSTLVDRIVPGKIQDEEELARLAEANGYEDKIIDVGEVFSVWYIEGDKALEDRLPFKKAGLNVHVVPDIAPYKKRKVRILNGAHTGFVLGAYLAGKDIVRECMEDKAICGFMNRMLHDVVIPILPLPKDDCEEFAASVEDRFNNPFINHQLLSISLNSTAKWKARNLPSLLEYAEKFGKLPPCLVMSLAAYIAFYGTGIKERAKDGLLCTRPKGDEYKVQDDDWVLDFYYERKDAPLRELVHDVLSNTRMWDEDLTQVAGLEQQVLEDLEAIRRDGAAAAFAACK
ncbi:MAG: tagaturonate reductase [Selenomonadaceae bacterium]|nr:tagaturonate reductase [Selenomonadaceae bacterium]